jgi:GTP 3',8-cyclase
VRGFNDDEVGELCRYAWQRGFVPRFIEQMPMADGQLFVPGELLPAAEIRRLVAAAFPGARLVPVPSLRPGAPAAGAGPARYFRLEGDADEEAGGVASRADRLVGIISAMTEHFCDTCNRLRLSAAGAVHTCLGHDDATDLRGVLRTQGEAGVIAAIRRAVAGKREGHRFQLLGIGGPRKAMVQIGG